MKKADLERYKGLLEAKQQELAQSLRTREPISFQRTSEPEEEAQRTAEQDLAVQDRNRAAEMLRQTRAALDRIEDGSYGVCLSCEQEIEPRRLAAVPSAAYCVRCQETLDQQEAERFARQRVVEAETPVRQRAA
jgi:DnaK suppressor protein